MTQTDMTVRGTDEAELITNLPFLRGIDALDGAPLWQATEACLIDVIGPVAGESGFFMNLRCGPGMLAQIPPQIIVPLPAGARQWF